MKKYSYRLLLSWLVNNTNKATFRKEKSAAHQDKGSTYQLARYV